MPDYQNMCLKMARATEKAISILIQSQQETEEIYISTPEPDIQLFVLPEENEPNPK